MSKFNFNIDIEDVNHNNSLSKSKYNSISQKQIYEDLYLVDLGLPSGVKWCKYNLGCDYMLLNIHPENSNVKDWYGDYYAWGETESKTYYDQDNYKFGKNYELTKYCNNPRYGLNGFTDNLLQLQKEDDIAYQKFLIFGNLNFRIPTKEQFKELIKYTTNIWYNNYKGIQGLYGRVFSSKQNGNEIFIPAAGYFSKYHGAINVGGYIWTSDISEKNSKYATSFYFDDSDVSTGINNRFFGFSIRAVRLI